MIDNAATKAKAIGPVLTDVRVLVRDSQGWLQGQVHEDIALTLIGLASEDPQDWNDVCGHWLRYHTPPVPRDVREVPLARCEQPELASLQNASGWVVVDLEQRRILTGGRFQAIERNTVYDMCIPGGKTPRNRDGWALPVCLPPWWELEEHAQPATVARPRIAPAVRPRANRRVLYGEAVREDLAARIAQITQCSAWNEVRPTTTGECYEWIVESHRDWLMTPRADLGGQTPRQQLHGAQEWLEGLVEHQRTRASEFKCLVARPAPDLLDDQSPMSREEVCEYFEFCRAMLEGGFRWALDAQSNRSAILRDQAKTRRALAVALGVAGAEWLETDDQDGFNRRFAREAARRRMPLAIGIPVHGMEDVAHPVAPNHDDCACPICKWDAEHAQSTDTVTFVCYDGYHLDHDQEFAFSLCDDYDEWQFMYGGCEEAT